MEKLLNTTEAAEALGVSVRRVVQLIKAEKLTAQKVGRDYAIAAKSLESVTIHGKPGRPLKAAAAPSPDKPRTIATKATTAKRGGKR